MFSCDAFRVLGLHLTEVTTHDHEGEKTLGILNFKFNTRDTKYVFFFKLTYYLIFRVTEFNCISILYSLLRVSTLWKYINPASLKYGLNSTANWIFQLLNRPPIKKQNSESKNHRWNYWALLGFLALYTTLLLLLKQMRNPLQT